MIRINLLPEKEVKRRRAAEVAVPARRVSPPTILILVAMFALLGGYYYLGIHKRLTAAQRTERDRRSKKENLDTEIEKRQKGALELQKVENLTKSMLDIVYSLDPEDRLLWSQKLNQISDLVPANVWVTGVTITESIAKKETAGSKRQRKQWELDQLAKGKVKKGGRKGLEGGPPQVFYPEISQSLQIHAIAYSETDAERIRLINEFHANLFKGVNEQARLRDDFTRGFRPGIDIGPISPRIVGGRNVADFSFTLKTIPTVPKDQQELSPAATIKGVAAKAAAKAQTTGDAKSAERKGTARDGREAEE